MYTEFLDFCKKGYPDFKEIFEKESVSPNLFSFQTVTLPVTTFDKIKEFIRLVYQLRNNSNYQRDILGSESIHPNYSVLMSFDFHIVDKNPKLIEINTNASHFLTANLMDAFVCRNGNRKTSFESALDKLKNSFQKEWTLFSNQVLKTICIVDEDPENQRAYFEFLLYKKMFESMGYKAFIEDPKNLKYENGNLLLKDEKIDFVYNRSTDFYFETQDSSALKEAYKNKSACFSPQPQEYELLADKKRLLDFSDEKFLEKYLSKEDLGLFQDVVLKIIDVNTQDKESLWTDRKKYFFKPKNSFGGKGVYKGESITHKTFDQLVAAGDYVAQEFAPPPTTTITDQVSHKVEAKYDLRFFVYNSEIQFGIARTYVGQTTNFRTLGGGFASIEIK